MKKDKVIYYLTTGFIVIFEGVVPALTFNTQMSKEGVTNLGYPLYFLYLLTAFKVAGAIVLAMPNAPAVVKEWAYAGFTFVFISAFVSYVAVEGFGSLSILPLVALAILGVSYKYYKNLSK
jgi:hypothetical protein